MTTYYNINPKFYVSVDCIIFGFDEGELKLLLLKRNFEPAIDVYKRQPISVSTIYNS